jgi:hypothetical protein
MRLLALIGKARPIRLSHSSAQPHCQHDANAHEPKRQCDPFQNDYSSTRSYSSGRVFATAFTGAGRFSSMGLRVHAASLIRSPCESHANAYESVFLFRLPSES